MAMTKEQRAEYNRKRRKKLSLNGKAIVYRYTDKADGIIKYVGITSRYLDIRLKQHDFTDKWCKYKQWKIEYFVCDNRSEAEAFEAHLIALYGTKKYYNKSKSTWGINKYLPDVENWWIEAKTAAGNSPFTDEETEKFANWIRQLIRAGEIDTAKEMLQYLDFESE